MKWVLKNTVALGALLAVAIVAAIVLGYVYGTVTRQVACTTEAKLCPDGSAVGRTGPTCEFAPCPSATPVKTRSVQLMLYNPAMDKDASGNIMCSAAGLVPVKRDIPFTNTPIQDTVRLLLTTKPTSAEHDRGLVSELPLEGVTLVGASVNSGVLTLTFNDPNNRTGGGSCFVSILAAQITSTARQFGGISDVRLMPDYLFQP